MDEYATYLEQKRRAEKALSEVTDSKKIEHWLMTARPTELQILARNMAANGISYPCFIAMTQSQAS
jgi:hypothetical protein